MKYKPVRSVDGLVGCLIYCGDGNYRIRFYDEHKLATFIDCDIKISDLFFEVKDSDAYMYENENGDKIIDHSPDTLGINYENTMP